MEENDYLKETKCNPWHSVITRASLTQDPSGWRTATYIPTMGHKVANPVWNPPLTMDTKYKPITARPAASGSAFQASLIQLWAMQTKINKEIKEGKKNSALLYHLGKMVLGDRKPDKPILQYFQHNRVSYSGTRILLYCSLQPFSSTWSICDLLPSNRKRVFLWCTLGGWWSNSNFKQSSFALLLALDKAIQCRLLSASFH